MHGKKARSVSPLLKISLPNRVVIEGIENKGLGRWGSDRTGPGERTNEREKRERELIRSSHRGTSRYPPAGQSHHATIMERTTRAAFDVARRVFLGGSHAERALLSTRRASSQKQQQPSQNRKDPHTHPDGEAPPPPPPGMIQAILSMVFGAVRWTDALPLLRAPVTHCSLALYSFVPSLILCSPGRCRHRGRHWVHGSLPNGPQRLPTSRSDTKIPTLVGRRQHDHHQNHITMYA